MRLSLALATPGHVGADRTLQELPAHRASLSISFLGNHPSFSLTAGTWSACSTGELGGHRRPSWPSEAGRKGAEELGLEGASRALPEMEVEPGGSSVRTGGPLCSSHTPSRPETVPPPPVSPKLRPRGTSHQSLKASSHLVSWLCYIVIPWEYPLHSTCLTYLLRL